MKYIDFIFNSNLKTWYFKAPEERTVFYTWAKVTGF